MKLISMTDFALEQSKIKQSPYFFWKKIEKYAYFLKQNLKLEMFVPLGEDGNVLEKPNKYTSNLVINDEWDLAKEKVLFEGFEIYTNKEEEMFILGDYTCLKVSDLEKGTIEDLVKYVYIKLTPNAIKRIFG